MLEIIKAFVDIAFWRRGPQHLPASALLFLVTMVTYLALSVAISNAAYQLSLASAVDPVSQPRAIDHLVGLALMVGWIALLLTVTRRSGRFLQTATAVLGVGIIIEPVAILLPAALSRIGAGLLVVPLFIGLFSWYLLAISQIIASALQVTLLTAVLLTFAFLVCQYFVTVQLLQPGT